MDVKRTILFAVLFVLLQAVASRDHHITSTTEVFYKMQGKNYWCLPINKFPARGSDFEATITFEFGKKVKDVNLYFFDTYYERTSFHSNKYTTRDTILEDVLVSKILSGGTLYGYVMANIPLKRVKLEIRTTEDTIDRKSVV